MSIYSTITDRIVAQIEAVGVEKWEAPWRKLGRTGHSFPVNVKSGKAYRGVNTIVLALALRSSNVWGTFKQWKERGTPVRKGEKATMITFWKFDHKEDKDTGKIVKMGMCRAYFVFNAEQVDGYVEPTIEPADEMTTAQRIEEAEAFFAAIGGVVRHGGDRAYYNPTDDAIQMPTFEQFAEAEGYYSVLGHEYVHWTGSKDRLAREFGKRFGDEAYGAEELVAELGTSFLMGTLGLSIEPRADHAKYLAAWLRLMKADSKAIFATASKAQAAADFLLTKGRPEINDIDDDADVDADE